MSIFTYEFVGHLSKVLEVKEEAVEKALEQFVVSKNSAASIPKNSIPKKDSSEELKPKPTKIIKLADRDTEEVHYCENIQRGKQYACGSAELAKERGVKSRKRATKFIEVNGKKSWYCGTEKSGCYKSAKGAAEKAEQKSQTESKVTSKSSVPKKSEAEVKSKVLENSRRVKLGCKKIYVDGKTVYCDPELRYVACKETKKVYGKLSLDKKMIENLTPEDEEFLDKNGILFEQKEAEESSDSDDGSKKSESGDESSKSVEESLSEDGSDSGESSNDGSISAD